MKITITRVPSWWNDPDELGRRLRTGVRIGLHAAGRDAIGQIRDRIMDSQPSPPVDTGALMGGMVATPSTDGLSVTVGPAPTVAERGSVMELGRRPGQRMPPVDALERWVHHKNLSRPEKERFDKRGRARRLKGSAKAERALAYVIARSIAKKGIRARRYIRRALPGIRERLPDFLRTGLAKALQGPPPPPTV